jgi:hypothetical protein
MKKSPIVLTVLILCLAAITLCSQESPVKFTRMLDSQIPRGAKIFIAPLDNGYHIYLAAAIQKKQVPVVIVTDKSLADFELSAVTESDKANWAKMLFLGSGASAEQASIQIVNLKTSTVVFGYNVNKSNSARGKQSSAESCAKHLKEKIESAK